MRFALQLAKLGCGIAIVLVQEAYSCKIKCFVVFYLNLTFY